MPWCPTCKNEYKEGNTICADCGDELVATLEKPEEPAEPELLFIAENRSVAEKFTDYLEYSDISGYEIRENDFKESEIYLPPEKITEARRLLIGFQVAMENATLSDNPDDLELLSQEEERVLKEELEKKNFKELREGKSTLYVKASEKYNDLKFSAISFIFFAIVGFFIIVLHAAGAIDFLNSFSAVIMGAVFFVFLVIGMITISKAKNLKSEIGKEESQTEQIKDWMHEHFTNGYYDSLKDDSISPEKHYFKVLELLMTQISEAFPNIETDYLEQLVDENYNVYLDHYGNH